MCVSRINIIIMVRCVCVANVGNVPSLFIELLEDFTTSFEMRSNENAYYARNLPTDQLSFLHLVVAMKDDCDLTGVITSATEKITKLDDRDKRTLSRYLENPFSVILTEGALAISWDALVESLRSILDTQAFNVEKFQSLWKNRGTGTLCPLKYLRSVDDETVCDSDAAVIIECLLDGDSNAETYVLPVLAALVPKYDGLNILNAFRKAVLVDASKRVL